MKCEYLSASSASVYEQCPLRYYAKYVLGKKSGTTPAIGAGLIAHKALELFYRPDFSKTPDECFKEASTKEFCPDRGQFEEAREMFLWLVENEPKEGTNTITTELDFKFYLESGSAARGFIDRIDLENDSTIRIVDYKTGAFSPSLDELEKSNQTNIYAAYIFLEEKFANIDTVVFNYKYLRLKQQKTIKISRKMSYQYLEYFDHLFHAVVNDNDPKPTINSLCWNCEHRGECPEYLNALNVIWNLKSACGLGCEKISSAEEAETIGSKELVDVYAAVSTMSSCLDKEKKLIGSWLKPMVESVGTKKIESEKNIAKIVSRKDGINFLSISKK